MFAAIVTNFQMNCQYIKNWTEQEPSHWTDNEKDNIYVIGKTSQEVVRWPWVIFGLLKPKKKTKFERNQLDLASSVFFRFTLDLMKIMD